MSGAASTGCGTGPDWPPVRPFRAEALARPGLLFYHLVKATIARWSDGVKNGLALWRGMVPLPLNRMHGVAQERVMNAETPGKKRSKIQARNRRKIREAALEVFSQHGFRGATLDQVAAAAGLSKPNILYYYDGKEAIFVDLLNELMGRWLEPLRQLDPAGEPLDELRRYIARKVEMSREMPRESRLFANEIVQGAPRMGPQLAGGLKTLFDDKMALISTWMDQGRLARCDPAHLIFSIWATTQHYADFDAQIRVLAHGEEQERFATAADFLDRLYTKLLTP